MTVQYANLVYLVAAVLFILGIKGLTHPRTAVRGNLLSALGMLLAVVVTLMAASFNWYVVGAGLVVGAVIGIVLSARIQMTAMPQMVALLNGFGGAASVLVAGIEAANWAVRLRPVGDFVPPIPYDGLIATGLSGLIGAVTFFGSLVAFGKLQELKAFKKDLSLPAHQWISLALLAGSVLCCGLMVHMPTHATVWYWVLVLLSSVLGFMLVVRIGGADMPVVIALLNSYSGLAAAATGFVLGNTVLIITGSLVGASGIILTAIMCRAMNRSIANVLFGGIDAGKSASADDVYGGKVKSTTADDIGMLLDGAQHVMIVPGYGMAVAQAQYAVRDLYRKLEERGITVNFAIHPVAGRMPGHMNVLLAEVDIPYDHLLELEAANSAMAQTDLVLVIGANDVVNPDGRNNPTSPIAGMPVIDVDKARTVVVVKRSLSPGFAGIPNPLFAMDNCLMFFNDGKQAVLDIVKAVDEA